MSIVEMTQTKPKNSTFKSEHAFEARAAEAARVTTAYPCRVPVIVEPHQLTNPPKIDKTKFLVPRDITLGQFLFCIRKRLSLHEGNALFFQVSGTLLPMSSLVGTVYEQHVDFDGFVYITYSTETTFGNS